MKTFRWLTAFFVVLLLLIILAADLGLAPAFFNLINSFSFGDKLGHFVLLGLLALLVNLGFPTRRAALLGAPLLTSSLIIAGVITLEEFSQLFLAYRSFSLLDLAANYAGIFLFGELGAAMQKMMLRASERRRETL